MLTHPSQIEWIEGDLPDVHSVPKNCSVLAWSVYDIDSIHEGELELLQRHNPNNDLKKLHGTLCMIEVVFPWKNDLNPLRWDIRASYGKVKYWAWLEKGDICSK